MVPYAVPRDVEQVVFYPVEGGRRLDQTDIKKRYPDTWAYLKEHEKKLKSHRALSMPGIVWWRPQRLRGPSLLFSAKIVCPHLMFTPRFAADLKGRFVVTRSPFIVAAKGYSGGGNDLLKYLIAVLNSAVGFWQISTQSHKYSRQYAMVENKTLSVFRLPDPRSFQRS